MINGKLTDRAITMVRSLYGLEGNYEVTSVGVAPKTITLGFTNHLMTITVKVPTNLVEDTLEMEEEELLKQVAMSEEEATASEETPEEETEETEENNDPKEIHTKVVKERVKRNAKKANRK